MSASGVPSLTNGVGLAFVSDERVLSQLERGDLVRVGIIGEAVLHEVNP
jgi:ATP phosphoribosyltransferase